jgi:hypothetical protein
LTATLLEQVYTVFFDHFWKTTYGELHLSHLVERERSSGKIRLIRWLERLHRNTKAGQGSPPDPSQVLWRGRMIPIAQAEKQGYLGGWERFAPGDHPDDNLETVVRRLQEEGKLPIPEKGQVSTHG